MNKLLLFDIDGTLIDSGGAGMTALNDTARELFGSEGPPLDLAGSTDLGIVNGILKHFDSDLQPEVFYELYLTKLPSSLNAFANEGRVLSGVIELLDKISQTETTLGLLTGNIAAGAQHKVDHYGLTDYFNIDIGAYGDDHYDRNRLGPVAMERARIHCGKTFSAENAYVIGDTPKDIACGKAVGAKTIAVATGKFSYDELAEYKPDLVVANLLQAEVAAMLL